MFGINVEASKKRPHEGCPERLELRGPLARQFKFRLAGAAALVVTMASLWRMLVVNRRRRVYHEFYEYYPSKVDFIRMRRVGVFQSVNPDGSPGNLEKPEKE